MSRRASAWLAWSVCALALALTVSSLLLLNLNLAYQNTHTYAPWLDNTLTAISFAPVGALVASRHPANPVGWLLCLFGLVISTSHFGAQYAIYALLARPGSLPAGEALAWLISWLLPILIGLQLFLLFLFPTGRLPGRRWRWAALIAASFVIMGVIFAALSPGALLGVLGPIQNPFGIRGFSSGYYKAVLYFMSTVLFVVAISSLFVRLHRAVWVERQQIKWFVYSAAASVGSLILAYPIPAILDTPLWFDRAGFALNIAFIPAIPISIGIAILRYRLYGIDLVINRTLVYGTLTTMLVALYLAGVTTAQTLFRLLTGQEQQPQLAIVASRNTMQHAHVSLWLRVPTEGSLRMESRG